MGPLVGPESTTERGMLQGRPGPRRRLPLVEAAEIAGTGEVAELAEGLRLDLPDALARHVEAGADLLERVVGPLAEAEAQAEHLLFARRERRQHPPGLVAEVHGDDRLDRRQRVLVLDEVAEMAVLVLADGRLERDRLAADAQDAA